jgi:nucleoside phosphorylase
LQSDLNGKTRRKAIILSALDVEINAVKKHLTNIRSIEHPKTHTVYEIGEFEGDKIYWEIVFKDIGRGNPNCGVMTERAINHFDPCVIIFVGIAGGIKDVIKGDIVVAEKIYDYESGKIGEKTIGKPQIGLSSHAIFERAKYVKKFDKWKERIIELSEKAPEPKVEIRAIATGEKVIVNTKSEIFKYIIETFGDAIAVETEAIGFITPINAYSGLQALLVRGISDMIDDKNEPDNDLYKVIASDYASAFIFQILYEFSI